MHKSIFQKTEVEKEEVQHRNDAYHHLLYRSAYDLNAVVLLEQVDAELSLLKDESG